MVPLIVDTLAATGETASDTPRPVAPGLRSCSALLLALIPEDEATVFLAFADTDTGPNQMGLRQDLGLRITNADVAITVVVLALRLAYAAAGLTAALTLFSALCVISLRRCFQSDW